MSERADRIGNVEFADMIGLTRRAVTYMSKEDGAPIDSKGWLWPDCLRWYVKREKARAKVEAKPTDIGEATKRQAIADAIIAEARAAKVLDETMTVGEYEAALRDAFFRVDAKIKNLLPRLAGVCVGLRSPADGLKRFGPLIEEVRAELHRADDVPGADDGHGRAA